MGVAVTALIFASLLPVALSACSCGNTTILIPFSLTPTNIYNPKDETGKPCAMDCTYTLTYTGTPNDRSLSLNYIYFNAATDNAECLTIYDGAEAGGNVICPQNCDTAPEDPCVSTSPSLTIALRTTGTPVKPASFYLIVTVVQRNVPTTTPPITTTGPSITTTGGGTGGPCSPSNVQMDLIVLIDCSGLINSTTFMDMRSFVDTGILSKLNIQPRDPKLTQVTAAWVIPRKEVWGTTEDWAWMYNDLKIFVAGARQWATAPSPSFYTLALSSFRDASFAGPPTGSPLRRQNAPAVLYIISGSGVDPDNGLAESTAKELRDKLSAKIFTANVGALDSNNIGILATPYLAFKYNTTSDLMKTGSDDFFNMICDGNKLCGVSGVNTTIQADTPIQLVPPGQKYCNNMKFSWAYTTPDNTNASVTFDWFDIEFERDYIEVFDGSNMSGLALLSGYNTKGATVTSGSPSIVIVFQSNGNNVYTGFAGTVRGVPTASEVRIYGDTLPNID